MRQHLVNTSELRTRVDVTRKVFRGNGNGGTRSAQHAGNALNIGVLATDTHGVGHGARNETGILAAKEHSHEVWPCLSDNSNAITTLQPCCHQLAGNGQGQLTQAGVRQHMLERATRLIEVEPGYTLRRIVQPLGNGGEATDLVFQSTIGARRANEFDFCNVCRLHCSVRCHDIL